MITHTPGPWTQSHRETPDGMWRTEVYDAHGETIAALAWYPVELGAGVTGTAREANARLIAAAPDLLAACKAFLVKWEAVLPAINSAFVMQHVHGGNYSGPTLDVELDQIAAAIAKADG